MTADIRSPADHEKARWISERISNPAYWLGLALLLAAGFKLWLVFGGWLPFNADEAVVALMARHILQGARPVFFYGQAYMGSLDAFLVAGAFKLFGEQVWAIRLVQSALYLLFLATTVELGKKVFKKRSVGVLGVLLLAIPAVNVSLYTTASLGGYGEALVLGNLILLVALDIRDCFVPRNDIGDSSVPRNDILDSSVPRNDIGDCFVPRNDIRDGSVPRNDIGDSSVPRNDILDSSVPRNDIRDSSVPRNDSWRRGEYPGSLVKWGLVGFLSGLGLWTFGLTLVYSLPALIFLMAGLVWPGQGCASPREWRKVGGVLLALLAGGVIGSLPWWTFALSNGWTALLNELGGGAIAGVEGLAYGDQVLRHLLNLLLFGSTAAFGLRPPWEVRWLALPLLPFVWIFWLGVLAYAAKTSTRRDPGSDLAGRMLLVGVMLALALGFVFTPFGVDASGRYFLPLAAPLALFAADLILLLRKRIGWWAFGLAILVVGYQLIGTLQSAFKYPPGITTQFYSPSQIDHRYDQALIDFLSQQGERFGYSNYWVSYPLAFLSEEKLIFTPRLPYHIEMEPATGADPYPIFIYTERDNRYQPYDRMAAESDRTAYISAHHPELNQYLRERFGELGVTWQEAQIGDFHIFYRLSRAVRPAEIGLGETGG